MPSSRRIERDDDWQMLLERARSEMRPWQRAPSPYLIDRLRDPARADRHWLRHHFAYMAQLTRERDCDEEQSADTLRWYVWMIAPGGVRVRVRVVLNPRTNLIFNAFPDRFS